MPPQKQIEDKDIENARKALKMAKDLLAAAEDKIPAAGSVLSQTEDGGTFQQLNDAEGAIRGAIVDLGGRPCGGGRPC